MPAVSLVVCVYRETKLLERLLAQAGGCYDELIVAHDGPEDETLSPRISQLAKDYGGKFFVRPRAYQQESHWPFTWSQATHDWILRLDADEVPSAELRQWLSAFRFSDEPSSKVSGYVCIWPLWDGQNTVTTKWPGNRIFLFHKQRVRFFGMAEQVPVPDGEWKALPLILEHRPTRRSYGLRNLLFRHQSHRWRRGIACSLLGAPSDLAVWRWETNGWPTVWEQIRQAPLRTGLYRLLVWPLFAIRDMWQTERRVILGAALFNGLHHFLIALTYWRLRRTPGARESSRKIDDA